MKQTTRAASLLVGALGGAGGDRRRGGDLAAAACPAPQRAKPLPPPRAVRSDSQLMGWAFLSAALSTGLAALGAGYAVARVGSAAVGAVAEKPELVRPRAGAGRPRRRHRDLRPDRLDTHFEPDRVSRSGCQGDETWSSRSSPMRSPRWVGA